MMSLICLINTVLIIPVVCVVICFFILTIVKTIEFILWLWRCCMNRQIKNVLAQQ